MDSVINKIYREMALSYDQQWRNNVVVKSKKCSFFTKEIN